MKEKEIAFVRVTLDEVPEYMAGIIRAGSVISEDGQGEIIKDHQELIDNTEYRSIRELISDIAKRLGVSEEVIQIE